MKIYDFDTVINRKNTNSLKFDFAVERNRPADVLPLWVADMDFRAPEPVLDALQKAVSHGIFGYSEVKEDYYKAAADWFERHFQWRPQARWLVKTPGVVFALALAIRSLTQPGDHVLLQPPVYYPFYSVIEDNDRHVCVNELILKDGHYTIDFDAFEETVRSQNVRLFLLCSPHNPVGRVWTQDELYRLGRICQKYHVFVVSDEIHCDFTWPGHPHTPFLMANPDLASQTVLCTAPSKTFNLAGLQISNIWIPDDGVRRLFLKELDRTGYSQLNTLGLAACQAAYESGEEWFLQCRSYIQANLSYLRDFLRECFPQVQLIEPEGTYFAWLDFSRLGLSQDELNDLIVNKARLWLDAGHIFGKNCGQFQRIVLACPRSTLQQALEQLLLLKK